MEELKSKKIEKELKELSVSIIDIFENVLDEHDIYIPDEYRKEDKNDDNEACIFGDTYYNLENKIYKLLEKFIDEEEYIIIKK